MLFMVNLRYMESVSQHNINQIKGHVSHSGFSLYVMIGTYSVSFKRVQARALFWPFWVCSTAQAIMGYAD